MMKKVVLSISCINYVINDTLRILYSCGAPMQLFYVSIGNAKSDLLLLVLVSSKLIHLVVSVFLTPPPTTMVKTRFPPK